MMLKGQPLAYNKDLQEDKPPLFDAMTQLGLCLGMATRVIQSTSINHEACAQAALAGYANATELADYLVSKGVPFRSAHEQVGALVQQAIDLDLPLEDLPIEKIQATCPDAEADVFQALTVGSALARRSVIGGTAPARVAEAINAHEARLDELSRNS
jgi:argininosuccinate lyase/amino-acid N-acetyltransferase